MDTPKNALTGAEYKGGNVVRLLTVAVERGYSAGDWAGFHQWRELGRTVRKGEKGTSGLTVIDLKNDEGKTKRGARGFTVFHYDQTDPLPKGGE